MVERAGEQQLFLLATLPPADRLDLGVQLAAFRIVQEALTNALKHAGPPDDEPSPAANRPERRFNSRLRFARYEVAAGPGIAGMAERAALYGGTAAPAPHRMAAGPSTRP